MRKQWIEESRNRINFLEEEDEVVFLQSKVNIYCFNIDLLFVLKSRLFRLKQLVQEKLVS